MPACQPMNREEAQYHLQSLGHSILSHQPTLCVHGIALTALKIQSMIMLKRSGDRMHPCLTPECF